MKCSLEKAGVGQGGGGSLFVAWHSFVKGVCMVLWSWALLVLPMRAGGGADADLPLHTVKYEQHPESQPQRPWKSPYAGNAKHVIALQQIRAERAEKLWIWNTSKYLCAIVCNDCER